MKHFRIKITDGGRKLYDRITLMDDEEQAERYAVMLLDEFGYSIHTTTIDINEVDYSRNRGDYGGSHAD